jgi:hypothetical protein
MEVASPSVLPAKPNDSCMAGKQLHCVSTASNMFKKQDSFENNGISLSINPV